MQEIDWKFPMIDKCEHTQNHNNLTNVNNNNKYPIIKLIHLIDPNEKNKKNGVLSNWNCGNNKVIIEQYKWEMTNIFINTVIQMEHIYQRYNIAVGQLLMFEIEESKFLKPTMINNISYYIEENHCNAVIILIIYDDNDDSLNKINIFNGMIEEGNIKKLNVYNKRKNRNEPFPHQITINQRSVRYLKQVTFDESKAIIVYTNSLKNILFTVNGGCRVIVTPIQMKKK